MIRETQTVAGHPALAVDTEWEGANRRVSCTYPNGRRIGYAHDALDRIATITDATASQQVARFDYVGPVRDLVITYGNGAVLDKRNGGYDSNRRHARHEWKKPGGARITSYVNEYDGPAGTGTNRRISEAREHLDRRDEYVFDSAYRMVGFDRGIVHSTGAGGLLSKRSLDGVDKMISYFDEGVDRRPEVDNHRDTAENGMNQYSAFDGLARTYDRNSSFTNEKPDGNERSDASPSYVYDHLKRIVEVRGAGGSLLARYSYTSDNRRVLRQCGVKTVRYLYRDWQVCEERDVSDGADTVLRQFVDGRHLDEHIQLKDYTRLGAPVYYYHCNSQGFSGAVTDVNADVVEQYEYSWLGRPLVLDAAGADLNAIYSDTADDVYFENGQTFVEEVDSAATGWLENELVGNDLEFVINGVRRSFTITRNVSYLESSGNYTNQYVVDEHLFQAGLQAGPTFRVLAPVGRKRADAATVIHSDNADDVFTNGDGTSTVAEFNATFTFATDSLEGKFLAVVIAGQTRFFEIVGNESFTGTPVTNEFTVRHERLEILVLPSANAAFSVVDQHALPLLNPYLFQGRRYDGETGLYYYRNRYYDPDTGEFVTIDPLGNWNHGQGNGFSAFAGDGWNNMDPLGLDTKAEQLEANRQAALKAGRTFTADAIERMKKYFMANAKPSEPGKKRDDCITCMNKGLRLLLDDLKQKVGSAVHKTMKALEKSGRATKRRDIEFRDAAGKKTKGVRRPNKLDENVWDVLQKLSGGDVGWSVFGLSIMDGEHSVTLTLDNSDPSKPRVYWSDQWSSKEGWKEYDRNSLNAEIEKLTKTWWDGKGSTKPKTRATVWRVKNK